MILTMVVLTFHGEKRLEGLRWSQVRRPPPQLRVSPSSHNTSYRSTDTRCYTTSTDDPKRPRNESCNHDFIHSYSESPVSRQCPSLTSRESTVDTLSPPNRGKTRLAKWYSPYTDDDKIKLKGEVHRLVAPRDQKHQSNFVEFRGSSKVIYRRYAGLFFCACVDANDNSLAYLEAIHFFVEVLDQFFGNVCELDLVFNFYKVGCTIWMDGSGYVC